MNKRVVAALGGLIVCVLAGGVFVPLASYRTIWPASADVGPAPKHFSLVLFPANDSPVDRAVWATLDEYEADAINVLSIEGEDKPFPRSAFTAAPPPSGAEHLIAKMNDVLASESDTRRILFQRSDRGPGDQEVSVVVVGPRGRHTRSCYEITKAGNVMPLSLSRWP